MSTFPFDYSGFFILHFQQYNVLLLVQVKQDKDSLRQTGNSFKTDIPAIMLMVIWIVKKNRNFNLDLNSAAESDV